MSQPPGLGGGCIDKCHCLVRIAKREEGEPQLGLPSNLRMEPHLIDERAMGGWIVQRKRLFQMRPGSCESAHVEQVPAAGAVTKNDPAGILTLNAQAEQI